MSRSLLSRLERLEQGEAGAGSDKPKFDWTPFRTAEEAAAWLVPDEATILEAQERSPALAVLRDQWARLGIPDPGVYKGMDIVEEALRLAGLPDPSDGDAVEPPSPANQIQF